MRTVVVIALVGALSVAAVPAQTVQDDGPPPRVFEEAAKRADIQGTSNPHASHASYTSFLGAVLSLVGLFLGAVLLRKRYLRRRSLDGSSKDLFATPSVYELTDAAPASSTGRGAHPVRSYASLGVEDRRGGGDVAEPLLEIKSSESGLARS